MRSGCRCDGGQSGRSSTIYCDNAREDLEQQYNQDLMETAQEVLSERRQNENFLKEIREAETWLAEREPAASILNLYCK